LAKLAEVKSVLDDHAEALKLYDQLAAERTKHPRPALDRSGDPPEALAAEELRRMGKPDEARKRLLDYMGKSGDYAYGRYSALISLLRIEPSAVVSGTVSPMQAAKIAYDAGYYGKTVEYLDALRATRPGSPELAEAALLTGRTFEASGSPAPAYEWYTATVQTYATSPEAPEAARRAGDMLVEQAAWDAALGTYRQAIERYPNAPESDIARVHAGVLAYRLEERDGALDVLRPLLASSEVSPTVKAQAGFWMGKVQKSLGNSEWRASLGQVSALSPGSCFDFRARSLLKGEPDGGLQALTLDGGAISPAEVGVRYGDQAEERRERLE